MIMQKVYKSLGVTILPRTFVECNTMDIASLKTTNVDLIRQVLTREQYGCLLNNLLLIELFEAPRLSPYDWNPETLKRDIVRLKTSSTRYIYKWKDVLPVTLLNSLITEFSVEYLCEALMLYRRIKESKMLEPGFTLDIPPEELPSGESYFWKVQNNLHKFVSFMEGELFNKQEFKDLVSRLDINTSRVEKILFKIQEELCA